MLTHLLAADPATPADVLTHLAAQPHLPVADALTLASHPRLPPGTPMTIDYGGAAGLHRALAHPGLPPGTPVTIDLGGVAGLHRALSRSGLPADRRREVIDTAAAAGDLSWNIQNYDDLTPAELAHVYATTTSTQPRAYAANTHTPPDVAADVAAELYSAGYGIDVLLADVLTLRHHLTPLRGRAHWVAGAPDPLAAYAQLILDHEASSTAAARSDTWWPQMLSAFPHPLLTAAALERAEAGTLPAGEICSAIANNTRATPEHRYRAATLSPYARASVMDTAPDQHLRAFLARAPRACGWNNPHATDATLRTLLHHATTTSDHAAANGPAVIALHPHATAALRTDALTADGPGTPWLTALVHHLNTRGTVLDVPLPHLRAAEATIGHARHWTAAAWAGAHTGPATLPHVQALLALEAAGFPGTLRELLTTSRTLAN